MAQDQVEAWNAGPLKTKPLTGLRAVNRAKRVGGLQPDKNFLKQLFTSPGHTRKPRTATRKPGREAPGGGCTRRSSIPHIRSPAPRRYSFKATRAQERRGLNETNGHSYVPCVLFVLQIQSESAHIHTRPPMSRQPLRNLGGMMNTLRNPSLRDMADTGQNRAHTPQPRHAFSSRRATPSSFMEIASVGHHSRHVPHPVQVSGSIIER